MQPRPLFLKKVKSCAAAAASCTHAHVGALRRVYYNNIFRSRFAAEEAIHHATQEEQGKEEVGVVVIGPNGGG